MKTESPEPTPYVAYVETPSGIYRERDGVIDGPFTRDEMGIEPDCFIPGCRMLRAGFSAGASISFGFGYGLRDDNAFPAA